MNDVVLNVAIDLLHIIKLLKKLIRILAVTIFGSFYLFKRRQKRFEQLYDILKDMNLSPEALVAMKNTSDQFLIEHQNLHIYFNNTLGTGSTAAVYKGHLVGPSPLHIIMKLVETQKFCDCDVAVKMASNFGQNEVENLIQEINAMKQIGSHEHIIGMLGWCNYNDKPCLVFELAQNDLLNYIRSLNGELVPRRIFLSILWQVSDGNFTIKKFVKIF